MKKNKFIYGSILMVIVNFIVRIIDFTYDVMLSKLIGAESMGLFQMAMSILMVFLIVSTAGIPTAISKLVAEQSSIKNHYTIRKILKVAISLTLILSILLSLVLILFGKTITLKIFKNEDMLLCIYLLAPAIIIISVSSVIRGYYYGQKMMIVPSISQIIEHITRFIIVLGLLYYIYPVEPIYGALIAICGITIGEVFDLIWLVFMERRLNKKSIYIKPGQISTTTILAQILHMATPLAISSIFNVLLRFSNTILIPHKLIESGYTNSDAIATFGRTTGMAMPLIVLPFIVTSAIVINIIPSLSEQVALKNYRNMRADILISIKITVLVAIPLTAIYVFFSEPLGVFLYGDLEVSRFINIMGYSTIFLALQHTFSGILHGLNKQISSTINLLIGMVIQLLSVYFLVGNPNFGINGYFIGFFLSSLITCLLHFITLGRFIKLKIRYIDLILKPLIATAVMIIAIYVSLGFLKSLYIREVLSFVYSLIIGGFSYTFVLHITKAIPQNLFGKLMGLYK